MYQDRPYHDWSSHCCDALRYFALSNVRNVGKPTPLDYPEYGFV
jgi:hypothetical protein